MCLCACFGTPFPACRCGMFFRQQGFLTACCGLYVRTYAAGKRKNKGAANCHAFYCCLSETLEFFYVNVAEICAAAVSLKLYLFHREYLPVTVPIVFKCNIIHNFHSV